MQGYLSYCLAPEADLPSGNQYRVWTTNRNCTLHQNASEHLLLMGMLLAQSLGTVAQGVCLIDSAHTPLQLSEELSHFFRCDRELLRVFQLGLNWTDHRAAVPALEPLLRSCLVSRMIVTSLMLSAPSVTCERGFQHDGSAFSAPSDKQTLKPGFLGSLGAFLLSTISLSFCRSPEGEGRHCHSGASHPAHP